MYNKHQITEEPDVSKWDKSGSEAEYGRRRPCLGNYHAKLHCYVVIELKEGKFKPEHAGKLNFYLSAVDDLLCGPEDKPTIGLLLCRNKRHFDVEYALRGINKPIGVASWETRIVSKLPRHLKSSLPTVEEIEAELKDATSVMPPRRSR